MADYEGMGIGISAGFNLGTKSPIDLRSVCSTLNILKSRKIAYVGQLVFVVEDNKFYKCTEYNDGVFTWIEAIPEVDLNSSNILLKGYKKAESTEPITDGLVLNVALGKLERMLDDKQDKLTEGFGIDISEDNVIDSEVEYHFQDEEWVKGSFPSISTSSTHYGQNLWTGYNGEIYYSFRDEQYEYDKVNNKWITKSWNPDSSVTRIDGTCIWRDYNNIIHYSDSNEGHENLDCKDYILDPETDTWTKVEVKGNVVGLLGFLIWKHNGVIYNTCRGYTSYLNSNGEWVSKEYNGSKPYYGWHIYNANGKTYHSYRGEHIVLSDDGETWNLITFPELSTSDSSSLEGNYVWTNHDGKVYLSKNYLQLEFTKEGKWITKSWNGYGNLVSGRDVFVTNNDAYFINKYDYLKLNNPLLEYRTRHNDKLQVELQPGDNIKIENNIISVVMPDTYTKDELNTLLSLLPKFDIKVVSSLPTTEISSNTIYI